MHMVVNAEFDEEIERVQDFQEKLKENIADQRHEYKKKFMTAKAKYDRPGLEIVENEEEMAMTHDELEKKFMTK